jgi:hypothetical protein
MRARIKVAVQLVQRRGAARTRAHDARARRKLSEHDPQARGRRGVA